MCLGCGGVITAEQFGPNKGQKKSIDPLEQATLKKLVHAAIEEGVLERIPGRRVEQEYKTEFDVAGTRIRFVAYLDMEHPGGVHDHKNSISSRYFKSPNKLRKNRQILCYLYLLLNKIRNEQPPSEWPEHLYARHNQFCRDPEKPQVRKTEVKIPVEEIEAAWEETMQIMAEMVENRKKKDWKDVPACPTVAGCHAFGGCPFLYICNKRETPQQYKTRLERSMNQTKTDPT